MIKRYIVDSTCNNMRFDRWFRNKLGKIPQGLIEKNLRLGKIKINKNYINKNIHNTHAKSLTKNKLLKSYQYYFSLAKLFEMLSLK